jgi:hypothetical protein
MAIPPLLYGSEGWILRRKDENSIQSVEMKFLRAVKGFARLDHIRNDKIREEPGAKLILTQIRQYNEKWENIYKQWKNMSPKKSMGISTNGKKEPGKAKNAVDSWARTGHEDDDDVSNRGFKTSEL